jgi:hypothetical protein
MRCAARSASGLLWKISDWHRFIVEGDRAREITGGRRRQRTLYFVLATLRPPNRTPTRIFFISCHERIPPATDCQFTVEKHSQVLCVQLESQVAKWCVLLTRMLTIELFKENYESETHFCQVVGL